MRTVDKVLLVSGMLFALGLAALGNPARAGISEDIAQALANNDATAIQGVVAANQGQADETYLALIAQAKAVLTSDRAKAVLALEQAVLLSTTPLKTADAKTAAADLKAILEALNVFPEDKTAEAGRIMAAVLECAGQPSLVAAEPNLYAVALAQAAENAALARQPGVSQFFRNAKNQGNRPANRPRKKDEASED